MQSLFKKIRQPEIFKDCWILNPTTEEIRPYRILIKTIPPYKEENNCINVAKFPVDYIISAIKSNDFSFKSLSENRLFYANNPKRKEFFALHCLLISI